jgi:hypothetical protein
LDPAVLRGLDLGSGERQAGFEPFQQKIIMAGMTVIAQDLDARFQRFDNRLRFDSTFRPDKGCRRSCFLVNAGKASRVKRLYGKSQPGSRPL